MENETADSIISELVEWAGSDHAYRGVEWLNKATQLQALFFKESQKAHILGQSFYNVQNDLSSTLPANKAEIAAKATDTYRHYQDQKAKVEMMNGMIVLARMRSRLSEDEFKQ
jgi:hypothetical protein